MNKCRTATLSAFFEPGRIGALQQFTSNKRQLYAAIEQVKWNPKGVGSFGHLIPSTYSSRNYVAPAARFKPDAEDLAERDFQTGVSDFRVYLRPARLEH
jgi:hypothetical protein